jgi:hypothetical protein
MEDDSDEDFLTSETNRIIANSSVSQMIGESTSADDIPVLSVMLARAARCVTFSDAHLAKSTPREDASGELHTDSIERLLKDLDPRSPPPAPRKQIVHGVFFGSLLLYPGWWTRSPGQTGFVSGEWQSDSASAQGETSVRNIRRWLNAGYEQWGPSWDLWNPQETEQFLFGQVGIGDEANSLPVIIAPAAAARIQSDLAGKLAAEVVIKGTLYHDDHNRAGMNKNVLLALDQPVRAGQDSMPYFLVVNDIEGDGSRSKDFIQIAPDSDHPTIYSAYMWHCLIRASDEFPGRRGTVTPPRTIFTWEHTNLMDRDCIAFNYESLLFKKRYLEDKLETDLLILQHSYSIEGMLNEKLHDILVDSKNLAKKLRATHSALSGPPDDKKPANILSFSKMSSTKKSH